MDRARVARMLKRYELTRFQKRVLMATLSIPKGETRTYKDVARMAGYPKAYRAVGTVLKNNPLPIIIPCHRVVRSDGSIGNYSALGGTKAKRALLHAEHAPI